MRLYIRNKEKYDPSKAERALVFVEFPDPRVFSVGQVKEEFKKKARAAKIDSLYFRQDDGSYEVLADDRTIGFYNIQDNAVLETTSNPLWAATIYYRLREVERDAANRADDPRAARGLEQSLIQKFMALGILFNGGNNQERQQPPYFEELDQLFEHLQTAGKKPVHMSQQTLDTLQQLKDEYEQNDIHERDSIGHFVQRQAVKLGLTPNESNGNGDDQANGEVQRPQGTVTRGGRGRGRGSNRGKRPNGAGRGGRRAPQKQRMCEDCEENAATQFCADCQPPLVLCDNCALVLHRGVTRRNHQLKDVLEAPAPAKGYTPKAYRAPFAMLVAFHRASNEVPSKMSLNAEELKSRAQPLTNTDLEIKQGRWFGGFDSLENALMKNELVQKEARTPKYSLVEKGQPIAARCSEFDYAVQNLTQSASVPTIPVMAARAVFRNRQVCLLVDSEEPLRERFVRVALQRGLSAKTRKLPVGDFLWVLLPPGVNPDTVRDMPEQELVLPMLVERKTWDDLWSSLKSTRFVNQVHRMKNCGLEDLFYLVEGSPKELKGKPGPEIESFLQDKIDSLLLEDQFLVNRTGSWLKTVEWLCHLTNMAIEALQSEGRPNLMTYSEFLKGGKLKRSLTTVASTSTVPATSTIWSATEFTDIIRSNSHGGKELHNLPVSYKKERSLIVIQGLTLYNKQCHKLLDKALADLLENPHQTAEACVQRHLQGVTDQLIHEDVPQWYILWLQVFKGVIVRRTDTEEESAEILGKFYQTSTGGVDALVAFNNESGHTIAQKEERLPEDDLMFANDSQEEDAMIRQALRASQYEDNTPEEVLRSSLVRLTSSTTTKPTVEQISGSSDHGLQQFSQDSMNEKEQLDLAMQLSKAENEAGPYHSGQILGRGIASAKTLGTSCATEQHRVNSHPSVRPRTKTDVCKSSCATVCDKKTNIDGTNDELEEALKQSLEEFQNMKHKQEDRNILPATVNDLEKALELSRLEYGPPVNNTVQQPGEIGGPCDMDEELQRVLEISKLEAEEQRRVEYEKCKSDVVISLNEESQPDASTNPDDRELRKYLVSKRDKDLAKAFKISKTDSELQALDGKAKQKSSVKSTMQDLQVDDDVAKALELSKREHRELKDRNLCLMLGSKEQSEDQDLERALRLSQIEYTQSTNCSLDGKQQDCDSEITILEKNVSDGLPRERNIPVLKLNCTSTSVKDSLLLDAGDGDVVPSSVTSEWDPYHENQDVFIALDHATPVGSSKCSAILLDSQELDDDDVFPVEDITKTNRKQLFPLEEENSMDDDFAYALKVQEELDKQVKSVDNQHNIPRASGPELEDQLACYRQSQKERYGTVSGKGDKSSRGIDFRRNVAAIACGKPVQIGIASPISRSGHSQRKQDSHRVLGKKSSSRIERNKCVSSPEKQGPHKDEVYLVRDDEERCKTGGCTSRSMMKSSDERPFASQSGTTVSPKLFSSSTSFERVHKRDPPTLSRPHSPSSTVHSPSVTPSQDSSHVKSSYDKPMGPKCGACGEVGHNKNSKMCPHYYTPEAVQRREEQSRKRKAKREEEERDLTDRLGALAAQRLVMEERTRTIGDQLDELRRQSENLANTQKMVEDVIKRKRKR